jgi:hypothetical protein
LEYLLPIEVKRIVGVGEIEGYGSTFGNVDLAGDIVAPGAFTKTLAEHKAANSMPALLWAIIRPSRWACGPMLAKTVSACG